MIPSVSQKLSAFIMFAFSGLFFIFGYASAYHMMSLDYDLKSTIKAVSPLIAASLAMLYLGFVDLYAHRKEKNTVREPNKKIVLYFALYFVFTLTGFAIAIVGFMEEIWGVCAIGFILVLVFSPETYKIYKMKCKNDRSK